MGFPLPCPSKLLILEAPVSSTSWVLREEGLFLLLHLPIPSCRQCLAPRAQHSFVA